MVVVVEPGLMPIDVDGGVAEDDCCCMKALSSVIFTVGGTCDADDGGGGAADATNTLDWLLLLWICWYFKRDAFDVTLFVFSLLHIIRSRDEFKSELNFRCYHQIRLYSVSISIFFWFWWKMARVSPQNLHCVGKALTEWMFFFPDVSTDGLHART